MTYNNIFLFSEAYIQNTLKFWKNEAKECKDVFENISSWFQEYKNDWILFEDIVLYTLGFEKELDGDYRWMKIMHLRTLEKVFLRKSLIFFRK